MKKDDVKKYIYGAIVVFLVGVMLWVGFAFFNACGSNLSRCTTIPETTSIPTLIPATLPAMQMSGGQAVVTDQCRAAAVDLIGAWVEAGASETGAFQFTDISGQNCESNFEEVKPLFVEPNFWYSGSISCVSCHSADMALSLAQLDLGSYAGIQAGSRRADAESKGTDILGAGRWKESLLYDFLTSAKADVPGHTEALSDLVVFAGKPAPLATPTP
jgi:hypothetical protein